MASLLSFWFWISCFGVLRDMGSLSLLSNSVANSKSRSPVPLSSTSPQPEPLPGLDERHRTALGRLADEGLVVPFAFRPHSFFSPPGWTPLLIPADILPQQHSQTSAQTQTPSAKRSRLWGLLYFAPALLMMLLSELAAELRIIHGFYSG